MWPFSKKYTLAESGIFRGFTDCHSHILPGVDDGVQTLDESLEILRQYEQLGVAEVWLTPHIMEDIPNTTEHLRSRFAELWDAYAGGIRLRLASENMLDALFERRLAENDLLPFGENGDHLLVETSYFNPPMDFEDTLQRIKSAGYYPVLAHPERYVYMSEKDYKQLKNSGIKFQMNIFSLTGMYGRTAQKKAGWLLKRGFYDIAGSDLHSFPQLAHNLPKPMKNFVAGKVPSAINF